jgi:hypothetical protein
VFVRWVFTVAGGQETSKTYSRLYWIHYMYSQKERLDWDDADESEKGGGDISTGG